MEVHLRATGHDQPCANSEGIGAAEQAGYADGPRIGGIRVSYPDLDRTDAVLTAGDDGDDLWQMLEHAHLEIVGMLPLHYEGGEPYRWHTHHDEERALVFDFAIELPFLGSDQFATGTS